MALANRIQCSTSTTGTGALTLASTGTRDATNGDYLAPAEVLSELGGRIVPYALISGGNFAYGNGSLSADGLTLNRDANEMSWNGSSYAASLLSLTGTSKVIITPLANDLYAASVGISTSIARRALTL